jgi:hypothetical protein
LPKKPKFINWDKTTKLGWPRHPYFTFMVYNSTYNKNNWRNGEVQKKQSSNFRLFYEFILWHLILHMTIITREKKHQSSSTNWPTDIRLVKSSGDINTSLTEELTSPTSWINSRLSLEIIIYNDPGNGRILWKASRTSHMIRCIRINKPRF